MLLCVCVCVCVCGYITVRTLWSTLGFHVPVHVHISENDTIQQHPQNIKIYYIMYMHIVKTENREIMMDTCT